MMYGISGTFCRHLEGRKMNTKDWVCLSEQNAFFAHSDNILVAMWADKCQDEQQRALDLISCTSGPEKE